MFTRAQIQLLTEGASHLGVALSYEDITRFSLYVEEVERWSKIADLIARTDPETVIHKHILDSLAVSPLVPAQGHILDLGSGAGFPGLVLALIEPAREVALLEARRKRVNFLKEVSRKIKLVNVKVYEGRAEKLTEHKSLQSLFDVVVTRATWKLKEFLQLASLFVANGGVALAMKSRHGDRELLGVETYSQTCGFTLQRKYKYVLPVGGERRQILIFMKERST